MSDYTHFMEEGRTLGLKFRLRPTWGFNPERALVVAALNWT